VTASILFAALGQFAVHTSKRDPNVSPEELAWRVTRRVQGDPNLGPKHG
jgi:hypothetical protein